MVLEAVYELDFLDCSYGFRPGRSPHQALEAFWDKGMWMGGGYVLKLDIRQYFDAVDHEHLRNILDKRVRDGVIRKTINKWLKAGILHEDRGNAGTPQGGVISPLLANIYLHEVLDTWFEHEVRPRLEGDAFLIRYGDDATLVFSSKAEAERVGQVLAKRARAYGLELHPEKTRLIRFTRPGPNSEKNDRFHPETFDLLGFTHYWGKSRKKNWVIKRKTAKDRFTRSVRDISRWCRRNRHMEISEQHDNLVRKIKGHYQHFGIIGNFKSLERYLYEVRLTWRKWLNRRSQKGRMPWDRYQELLKKYPLPEPKIVKPAVT
jgi:group II intron reverse transcriptase/maturase